MGRRRNTIQKHRDGLVYISIKGLILAGVLLSNRVAAVSGLFSMSSAYLKVLIRDAFRSRSRSLQPGAASLILGQRRKLSTPSR